MDPIRSIESIKELLDQAKQRAQQRGREHEPTFTCFECRDLGMVHVLVWEDVHSRWWYSVRPCVKCDKGKAKHADRDKVTGPVMCRWATFTGKTCSICGAHPGQPVPGSWNGVPVQPRRVLSVEEVRSCGTGDADDPTADLSHPAWARRGPARPRPASGDQRPPEPF